MGTDQRAPILAADFPTALAPNITKSQRGLVTEALDPGLGIGRSLRLSGGRAEYESDRERLRGDPCLVGLRVHDGAIH